MRRWRLNSGYNATTDQRRTKAGTIPMLKHNMERDLGEFLHVLSTGWTPASITTALWLDAADASTITIATGVSQWNDKSGNGWNATQVTSANQPTPGVDGGVNCLSFDGNDSMTLGNLMASATSGFYIGLIKFTSDPTSRDPVVVNLRVCTITSTENCD